MNQRLGVANLLVFDPPVIILDEPASGLDPSARIALRQVLARLAERGKTILISSHILTELEELVSHVCAMNHGDILASGSLQQIRAEMGGSTLSVGICGKASELATELEKEHALSVARSFPATVTAELKGTLLNVTLDRGDPSVDRTRRLQAEFNRHLMEADVEVDSLVVVEKGLEAVFMALSGGEESANKEASK